MRIINVLLERKVELEGILHMIQLAFQILKRKRIYIVTETEDIVYELL